MKNILLLLAIVLSASCQQEKKSVQPEKEKTAQMDVPFESATTAFTPDEFNEFPAGFEAKSLSAEDTVLHFSYDLHFPQSLHDKKFNQFVAQLVKAQAMKEVNGKMGKEQTSFSIWLHDFKITGNLIQCLFIEQSFTEGAAHYNHGYMTLNYDFREHKRIFFTDVIHFSSLKQKQEFCDEYNEFNTGEDLSPEHLTKNTDFQMDNGGIVLYFDDYEQTVSMTSIQLEPNQIKSYLRPSAVKAYHFLEKQ